MYQAARYIGHIFSKSRPIHLTFFVTRRCNSGCPFCFYLKGDENEAIPSSGKGGILQSGRLAGEGRADKSKELSLDEIRKISGSLGSLLWLAFSGGEIYLRDDLVEISRVFYENNKPSIMLYPTNGLLPEIIKERTEIILRHCKNSIIAVKLSIDGLDGMHDGIRNTPGSFEKTMQTYRLLSEFIDKYPNFELGVNTVFCSENQNHMDGIIDFVRGLKYIKTHTISMIRGNIRDGHYKEVDFHKYNAAIMKLEENLKNKRSGIYKFRGARIKAAQDILQRRLIHRTANENRRLIPCYAGRLNIVLSERGEVFPCEILTESLGNVRDYGYDMRKLLASGKAESAVKSITGGGCYCTHECYFMTNILFNPALYPRLFKEYLQLRF